MFQLHAQVIILELTMSSPISIKVLSRCIEKGDFTFEVLYLETDSINTELRKLFLCNLLTDD